MSIERRENEKKERGRRDKKVGGKAREGRRRKSEVGERGTNHVGFLFLRGELERLYIVFHLSFDDPGLLDGGGPVEALLTGRHSNDGRKKGELARTLRLGGRGRSRGR